MLGTKTTFQFILLSLPWYLLSAQWDGATILSAWWASVNRCAFTMFSFHSPLIYLKGVCILWNASPRCTCHTSLSVLSCFHTRLTAIQQLPTQPADELEVLAACWLVESHRCSGLLREESHATHVSDQTYGLYISSLFKLYFKRWRCLFGLHLNN